MNESALRNVVRKIVAESRGERGASSRARIAQAATHPPRQADDPNEKYFMPGSDAANLAVYDTIEAFESSIGVKLTNTQLDKLTLFLYDFIDSVVDK